MVVIGHEKRFVLIWFSFRFFFCFCFFIYFLGFFIVFGILLLSFIICVFKGIEGKKQKQKQKNEEIMNMKWRLSVTVHASWHSNDHLNLQVCGSDGACLCDGNFSPDDGCTSGI